ncbi:MAG: pilin N-terminal domain-containing protein [Promicromonosporaceae bacterium]|nr:pilin N-terminal domain-containing protein [Promicromonosporaceae bacterium]
MRSIFTLLPAISVAATLTAGAASSAWMPPITETTASLTITRLTAENQPVAGVTLQLARLTETPAGNPVDLTTPAGVLAASTAFAGSGAATWETLASEPPFGAVTNAAGVVSLPSLPLGLYFVTEIATPDGYDPALPFLVALPGMTSDGTDWLYDVQVFPKAAALAPLIDIEISHEDWVPHGIGGHRTPPDHGGPNDCDTLATAATLTGDTTLYAVITNLSQGPITNIQVELTTLEGELEHQDLAWQAAFAAPLSGLGSARIAGAIDLYQDENGILFWDQNYLLPVTIPASGQVFGTTTLSPISEGPLLHASSAYVSGVSPAQVLASDDDPWYAHLAAGPGASPTPSPTASPSASPTVSPSPSPWTPPSTSLRTWLPTTGATITGAVGLTAILTTLGTMLVRRRRADAPARGGGNA